MPPSHTTPTLHPLWNFSEHLSALVGQSISQWSFPKAPSKVRPTETKQDLVGPITQPLKLLESLYKCNSTTHHSHGSPMPPESRSEKVVNGSVWKFHWNVGIVLHVMPNVW